VERQLSVIICTHNPRSDYLRRTLESLRAQTLPTKEWELLLVDNASSEPLASRWDLRWHDNALHVREEELGLTPARLRGIRQSRGRLLIFVDDEDNVFLTRLSSDQFNHLFHTLDL
jgi:glycosyltransferase involved in cell wall biosynthesis